VNTEALELFESASLAHGGHSTRGENLCAMEWAAYLAGEEHTDHPPCVSPVIAAFVRRWNDDLNDDARNQLLKPMIPKLLETASAPEVEEARAFMAADWMVRKYLPAWLDLTPSLAKHAATMRALPTITDSATWLAVEDPVRAAGAAAWAAARAAAWAAARDAAGDAAWDAAWDAAGAAARDAAWAAARAAAWDAARAAARAAARDAAWDALTPTVVALQTSAVGLLRRMIEAK